MTAGRWNNTSFPQEAHFDNIIQTECQNNILPFGFKFNLLRQGKGNTYSREEQQINQVRWTQLDLFGICSGRVILWHAFISAWICQLERIISVFSAVSPSLWWLYQIYFFIFLFFLARDQIEKSFPFWGRISESI